MRFTLRPVKPHATHFTGTNPKPEISVAGSDNLPEPHDGHGSSVSFNLGILLHNATGATLTAGAAIMKMVHITKTPDGGYFIVDATGAPGGGASFAPTSSVSTEEGLRTALTSFGLTDKATEITIRQVNETGNSTVQL